MSKEYIESLLLKLGSEKVTLTADGPQIISNPTGLIDWIKLLKNDLDFLVLTSLSTQKTSYGFLTYYVFLNMENYLRVILTVESNDGEAIPSLSDYYTNASYFESKLEDKHSMTFLNMKGHASLLRSTQSLVRPEILFNPNKSEAPYPEENLQWTYKSIISEEFENLFECYLCHSSSTVMDMRIKNNFFDRNFVERVCGLSVEKLQYHLRSLNHLKSTHYEFLWLMHIEESFSLKIPERAQAIRILSLELSRLVCHFQSLFQLLSLSHEQEAIFMVDCSEKIQELFEKLCGHRLGQGIMLLGGVNHDFPYDWIVEMRSFVKSVQKMLKQVYMKLIHDPTFRILTDGKVINAQTVLKWGLSGPVARAAGVNSDLRKNNPFYFYNEIDFDIPVGVEGKTYDRFLIKIEEIFQSARIITQVLDNLPLSDVRYKEDLWQEISRLPLNSAPRYTQIESADGELGVLGKINQSLEIEHLHIKNQSSTLMPALRDLLHGVPLISLHQAVKSLDINFTEMDC